MQLQRTEIHKSEGIRHENFWILFSIGVVYSYRSMYRVFRDFDENNQLNKSHFYKKAITTALRVNMENG